MFFVLLECVFFVVLGLWDQSGFGAHLLSFLSKTETEGNEKLPLHISSWKNDFYKKTLPVDPKHLEPQILILSVCFTFFHLLRVKRGRIQNTGTGLKKYTSIILPDKNQHKIKRTAWTCSVWLADQTFPHQGKRWCFSKVRDQTPWPRDDANFHFLQSLQIYVLCFCQFLGW